MAWKSDSSLFYDAATLLANAREFTQQQAGKRGPYEQLTGEAILLILEIFMRDHSLRFLEKSQHLFMGRLPDGAVALSDDNRQLMLVRWNEIKGAVDSDDAQLIYEKVSKYIVELPGYPRD